MAKWRAEEGASGYLQISGTSTCRAFTTGHYFSLVGNQDKEIKVPETSGKYALESVKHSIQQSPEYISGAEVRNAYQNTFSCISQDAPFRPARTTPRPSVQGMQTAVVVGLKGEEIDCDKYGRVKVQFHWDREGKKDEKSSCWVRVASMWAGKQWGMIHIPRIGQEVVVAFLEGDPDQPIIVGSVYNYDNMPPYKLPDNKTKSGIVTRSSKDGDSDTYNGIVFEDKKDQEQVYIQAQYNMDTVVKNNETVKIGFDKQDPGDQTIDIYNNRTTTLDQGNDKLTVKKGDREAIVEMGSDALTIKMGNQTTKLDLGKSATEAMQSIEFKVGQSSIKIDQMGVTIKGMMINVEGQMQTQVKGLMTQLNGSAMLTVGGGLMMIG